MRSRSTAHTTVVPPDRHGGGRRRRGGRGRCGDRCASSRSGVEQRRAVGARRAAPSGRSLPATPGGLDEQVGPRRRRRGRRAAPSPLGDPGAGQRQVALRRRAATVHGRGPRRRRPSGSTHSAWCGRGRPRVNTPSPERAAARRRRRRGRTPPRPVGGDAPRGRAATPGRRSSVPGAAGRRRPWRARGSRRRRRARATSGAMSDEQGRDREAGRRRSVIAGSSTWRAAAGRSGGAASSQPSTQPGTVTARMSPRHGMPVEALGPEPERRRRPTAGPARARTAPPTGSPGRWTRANRSPPMPHMCWLVTASTAPAATAASARVPPARRIATPADDARWSAVPPCPTGRAPSLLRTRPSSSGGG